MGKLVGKGIMVNEEENGLQSKRNKNMETKIFFVVDDHQHHSSV